MKIIVAFVLIMIDSIFEYNLNHIPINHDVMMLVYAILLSGWIAKGD